MSVSSAGTQLDFSETDIAVDAGSGWANLLCILDLDRDHGETEVKSEDGCLNSATSSPAIAKHKTASATDEGSISGTAMFDADKYAAALAYKKSAKKLWFRVVDPDNRDASGALVIADCSAEKCYGWITKLGKSHPAGGGRMTATFTIEVDTATYSPTP